MNILRIKSASLIIGKYSVGLIKISVLLQRTYVDFDTFWNGNKDDQEAVKERFAKHVIEKETVRKIRNKMKERAKVDEKFLVATFDLQQVLYLHISQRCELFYRQKLSCYISQSTI